MPLPLAALSLQKAKQQSDDQEDTTHFVLGRYLAALLDACSAHGLSLDVLAKACALSPAYLYLPPEKVPVERYLQLLESAKHLSGQPLLGLSIGRYMQSSNLDLLGLAMAKADNLGHATEQVLALESLVHRLGRSELVREDGGVRYVWHCHYKRHPLAQTLCESVLAGIVGFARKLAGRSMPVLEVTFAQSVGHDVDQNQFAETLGGRCVFGQSHNSLLVADEVLAWPVAPSCSTTRGFGQEVSQADFAQQVVRYLEQVLSQGNPALSLLASQLKISPRTLQRRLASEGHSYQALLSELRCRLAIDYLRYSNLNFYEIARLLGFAEQSSFNHFFQQHFEQAPQYYRASEV